MLAKALSPQNKENVDLALQFTEPYGTIRGVQDLKEDPSDPWNYLAAIPMLGRAAAFAKAIRKGNINDLPKENQWRYDESTTPQEMRQHYAEDYIGDLQDAELQGQDLIDEVIAKAEKIRPARDGILRPDYPRGSCRWGAWVPNA